MEDTIEILLAEIADSAKSAVGGFNSAWFDVVTMTAAGIAADLVKWNPEGKGGEGSCKNHKDFMVTIKAAIGEEVPSGIASYPSNISRLVFKSPDMWADFGSKDHGKRAVAVEEFVAKYPGANQCSKAANPNSASDTMEKVVANATTRTMALELTVSDLIARLFATLSDDEQVMVVKVLNDIVG